MRAILIAAVASLALAGCGDDGGGSQQAGTQQGGGNQDGQKNQGGGQQGTVPLGSGDPAGGVNKVPGVGRGWDNVQDPDGSSTIGGSARRPNPAAGVKLPPPTSRDQSFTIRIGQKKNSTGTAFSIADNGVWITARHVAFGCRVMGILTGRNKGFKVLKSVVHPNADVAILFTQRGAPFFPVARPNHRLTLGQNGFHFGYPRGKPGDVHSRVMGRRIMRVEGRYSTAEPVVAWAEQSRQPNTRGPLSGLSGGPILDKTGTIVGVHVAGSIRRGRIYSVPPISMHQVIQQARAKLGGRQRNQLGTNMLNPRDYPRYGGLVRRQLTSAKVLCLVNDPNQQRRRPPPQYETGGGAGDPT